MKKLLKKRQSGAVTLSREDDDFENFLLATRMRKCFYNETHNILGNTYGMCVLQVVQCIRTLLLSDVPLNSFLVKTLVICLLYTSPSPRDGLLSRMPSSA